AYVGAVNARDLAAKCKLENAKRAPLNRNAVSLSQARNKLRQNATRRRTRNIPPFRIAWTPPRQRSRSCGIEEVGLALDVEHLNSAEPGCAEQRFRTLGPHAGAKPRTAIRQRLCHAVEEAETVIHGR